jgi:subtilisin family serine protease
MHRTLTTAYGISKNYGVPSGNSMATPHVAGAAALYISGKPDATADHVRKALVTGGECSGSAERAGGVVCNSGSLVRMVTCDVRGKVTMKC